LVIALVCVSLFANTSTKVPFLRDFLVLMVLKLDYFMEINYAQSVDIQWIDDAFLMVHAVWSGQSCVIKQRFMEWFENNLYEGEVIIVDTDAIDSVIAGTICHGYGEIFRIRKGQIVASFVGNNIFEKFKQYVEK
jgi:hypothetical protein